MLKVQRLLGCSIVVAGTGLGVACASGDPSDRSEATGEAMAAITEVPADVNCVTIDVTGSRSVQRRFDVTPGESSLFSLDGLPVGDVIFNGSAHPIACSSITSASVATWISDPTPATLIAGGPATAVTINLKRNGQATVGVDFDDADADGGVCQPGFADCDGSAANGCETALNTVSDCGACGAACSRPFSFPACGNGVCVFTCAPGAADCNLQPTDGCETQISTDVTNCGACGSICSPAHATAACTSGQCGIDSCDSGFENCNGSLSDGCETNVTTSSNCGGCGVRCPVTSVCVDGICEPSSCLIPPCP